MAMTKSDSRSQSARARARQAMADELERARKRESKLVAVFSALDAREAAEATLGAALAELRDLGVDKAELSEMTGLAAREVNAAIRTAKGTNDEAPGAGASAVPIDTVTADADNGSPEGNSDNTSAESH